MNTILRAIVGYFFLLLTVRVLSRCPGAQTTPFEFVLIFLIGGVVILATVGDDRSEVNSVCTVIYCWFTAPSHRQIEAAFPPFRPSRGRHSARPDEKRP